jgi:hypothetical protein
VVEASFFWGFNLDFWLWSFRRTGLRKKPAEKQRSNLDRLCAWREAGNAAPGAQDGVTKSTLSNS